MKSEKHEIRLYRDFVPDFVESTLEALYENIFSSLPFLTIFNKQAASVSTYVLERNGVPEVVFLFRIEGTCVTVLNESMKVSAREIERFASYIFANFPKVTMVSLNAIRTELGPSAYPCQRFNCLEDIVVSLPATRQEYLASLSKAMRKNIKRYLNKLRLELPSLQHKVLTGKEIEEWHVRRIIELNKLRMQRKEKISTYDAQDTAQMIELAQRCGFVRIMELNGVIVAGEICTRIGGHYFSHVGAHDTRFDEYRLGTLNCYLTICECIDRGGKQFHFLWGQYDYKYSLRGEEQELKQVALYRSPIHLVLNGAKALKLGGKAFARGAKNLAHRKAKEENSYGRLIRKAIEAIQRAKRLSKPDVARTALFESPLMPLRSEESIDRDKIVVDHPFEDAKAIPRKVKNTERSLEACSE